MNFNFFYTGFVMHFARQENGKQGAANKERL
jgi:hypothetical protein